MHPTAMLAASLMRFAAQPVPLVLVIVLATFILEDVTAVTVGLLVSRMAISGPIALGAVLFGTILGDLILYLLARWAGRFGPVRRMLEGKALKPALGWLRKRALVMTAAGRFMPGLRLPIYLAAGSIHVPFGRFAAVVAASACIWTPSLFFLAIKLGADGVAKYGRLGWVLAGVLLLCSWALPEIVRRGFNLWRGSKTAGRAA